MKIEHLGTPEADEIRYNQLRGTTDGSSDAKRAKHFVFHVDNERGYALLKSPGGSYSNRSVSHYVSGSVRFIWLDKQGTSSGLDVWDNARDKDGTITPKLADELVRKIDDEIDSLCSPSEFAAECAANPGQPVNRVRLTVGFAYGFNDKFCLEDKLRDGPKCVIIKSDIYTVGKKYESTSEEYEARKRVDRAKVKEEQDRRFAVEWVREFESATAIDRVEMVLKLSGRK